MNINGIFNNKTKKARGTPDNLEIIIEIPVIPPSNIVLGIKKNSNAAAATKEPIVSIIIDKIFFVALFFILLINYLYSI